MATGYVRQSSGLIISGATILASHSENEFAAIASGMDATTGHNHDGTAGGGAPIDLTGAVTGALPIANGGTASTTASAARTALSLEPGTDVQAYDAGLLSIAGLTTAADKMIYTTASDTYAVTDLTTAGRALLDDASATAQRTTLGLGSIATQASSSVSITGGSVTGVTDIAIADGGTGSSTASDARTALGVAIGSDVEAFDADILKADTADVLTAGYATTPHDAGTQSSGTYTPDEANGNLQYAVNGGAHTLAPMSNDGSVIVQYTNDGSAGAITTSGFTIVTGDNFTTTNADDFMCYLIVNNGFSHLNIAALQ